MTSESPHVAPVRPLLLRPAEAALALGVSLTLFKSLETTGRLGPKPIHFGRAKRYSTAELARWIEAGCPGRVEWITRTAEHPNETRGLRKAL